MSDLEFYRGLLHLVSGTSLFVIMLLTLRLMSRSRRDETQASEGFDTWTVAEIIQETPNIKSFVLKRSSSRRISKFKAGQFLTFLIGGDAKRVRSYSISSSENNGRSLQVSIKHLTGGDGSTWFHSLKVGDSVTAYPPSGHFFDNEEVALDRVYVAGGIGVTPILSMIQTNLENAVTFKMSLFYGVRSQVDLAFHGLFEYWAKRHPNFKYYPVLSHDNSWTGDKGFLNLGFIQQRTNDIRNAAFFICGPDLMADPLIDALAAAGIPDERIHNEKFISPTQIDESLIPERRVTVTWNGQALAYQGRQNLLAFLESVGEEVPYACRTGVCGTCKCKIRGQVKSLTNAGLSRHEKKEGWTLACVSYPESDIEISF